MAEERWASVTDDPSYWTQLEPTLNGNTPRIVTATTGEFRLHVRTGKEIINEPDPPATQVLLGPLITRGERTIVVGDTGHGKTTVCLQMLGAVLHGETFCDLEGAGEGPVMIIDLEQGRKAIKRGLREAELWHDDILHISVPDGLALDQDLFHVNEVERVIAENKPVLLLLDPYYKAHRADDSNQERPIVDLMRQLDSFRALYGFALLLPAHPRKDIPGRDGARKLTLHDVAGSGAVTRGAEIVIGIERLNHGYARMRYLKDREGELPIGEHVALIYDKAQGFHPDPREQRSSDELEEKILSTVIGWKTAREWAKILGVKNQRAMEILSSLAESGHIAHMVGPPERHPTARCYGTVPECWEHMGTPRNTSPQIASEGVPVHPPSPLGEGVVGTLERFQDESGNTSDWEQLRERYADELGDNS